MKEKLNEIIGKKVFKVWRGGGSVIFVEFDGYNLMVEGDWVLKKARERILHNFKSTYEEIDEGLNSLVGTNLKKVEELNEETVALVFSDSYVLEVCKRDEFWVVLSSMTSNTTIVG